MTTSTSVSHYQQPGNISNSAIYNDPKYRCCCGVHVQKAAYIVAIVGIALTALTLAGSALGRMYEAPLWKKHAVSPVYSILTKAVSILACVAILYTKKKQNPSLYLPFLITQALVMAVIALYIILLLLLIIASSSSSSSSAVSGSGSGGRSVEQQQRSAFHLSNGATLLIFTIALVFYCWIYSLVFRAYKFANDEQHEQQQQHQQLTSLSVRNGGGGYGGEQFSQPPPQYCSLHE